MSPRHADWGTRPQWPAKWRSICSAFWLTTACSATTAPAADANTLADISPAGDTQSADAALPLDPTVTELRQVVPSLGLPSEVSPQASNNNLDIADFAGERFLTGRTAPDHFAGPLARLWVIRSKDEHHWQFETQVQLGTDVREPRLLAFAGQLRLYFAQLGDNPSSFEPKGASMMLRNGPANWTAPAPFYLPTFIPWRTQVWNNKAYMIGYTGGAGVYEADGQLIEVHLLQSNDGHSWQPATLGQPVVLKGGVSEVGMAFLADGSVVAVGRNERGETGVGFGSKICRAAPNQAWTCTLDKRKFDSPLVFVHGGSVWLIGRRTLGANGETLDYDVADASKPLADQYLTNQLANWFKRKRCSLWRVDPVSLTVTFALDLPSKGDTCFASALPADARRWVVYNYSSPLDVAADPVWFDGQRGQTRLYRFVLDFRGP
ncbi:MAG: hypothetical protein EXR77_08160 [Myxococcales bacterium]|nr:hypothetical protein [Myxococcales bacterium]